MILGTLAVLVTAVWLPSLCNNDSSPPPGPVEGPDEPVAEAGPPNPESDELQDGNQPADEVQELTRTADTAHEPTYNHMYTIV